MSTADVSPTPQRSKEKVNKETMTLDREKKKIKKREKIKLGTRKGKFSNMDGMEAFLYTEGIQLTVAHSGGRYSDLTQEEVQLLWRYNLCSPG